MPLPAALAIPALAVGGTGLARAALNVGREEEEPQQRQAIRVRNLPAGLSGTLRSAAERMGIPEFREAAAPTPTPVEREPEGAGVLGRVGDLATSATAGTVDVASGLVGLAGLPFRQAGVDPTGRVEEAISGFADTIRERGLSPAAQAERQQFSEGIERAGDGNSLSEQLLRAGKTVISHPFATANIAAESLPTMVGAGFLGAAARASRFGRALTPLQGAGIGEGAIMAGMASQDIRAGSDDPQAELAALGIGALGGAIPVAGGSLLSRMAQSGFRPAQRVGRFLDEVDPETIIAGGNLRASPEAVQRSLRSRVLAGAIREGFLEELPQTVQERIITNIATDEDPLDGVAPDALVGTTIGALLGGAFNLRGPRPQTEPVDPTRIPQPGEVPRLPPGGEPTPGELETRARESQERMHAGRAKQLAEARRAGIPETRGPVARPAGVQRSPGGPGTDPIKTFNARLNSQEWGSRKEVEDYARSLAGIGPKAWQGIEAQLAKQNWYNELPDTAEPGAEPPPQAPPVPPTPKPPKPPQPAAQDPETKFDPVGDPEAGADTRNLTDPDDTQSSSEDIDLYGHDYGDDWDTDIEDFVKEADRTGRVFSAKQQAAKTPDDTLASAKTKRSPQFVGGLYAAIAGFVDGGPASTVKLATGGTRADSPAWRRMSKRAADTLREIPVPNFFVSGGTSGVQEHGSVLDLMRQIHYRTQELERTTRIMATQEGTPEAVGGRVTRIDIPLQQYFDDIVTAELRDLEAGSELTGEAALLSAEAAATENFEDRIELLARSYARTARGLRQQLSLLEKAVGPQEIRLAMAAGKKAQFNQSTKAVPGTSVSSETRDAVRFSIYYSRYARNELESFDISEQSIRHENELAEKMGTFLPDSLELIAAGNTMTKADKAKEKRRLKNKNEVPRSRVFNVLSHFNRTSPSVTTRMLSSVLMQSMTKLGLHEENGKLTLDIVTPGTGGNIESVSNAAFYATRQDPIRPSGNVGRIEVFSTGHNPAVILHEVVHALTLGYLLREYNNPNNAAVRNLRILTRHIYNEYAKTDEHIENAVSSLGQQEHIARLMDVLKVFQDAGQEGQESRVAAELITYGLTEPAFQQWMKTREYTGPEVESRLRTLWRALTIFIKRLIGAGSVSNSLFEKVLGADMDALSAAIESGNATTVTDTPEFTARLGPLLPLASVATPEQQAKDATSSAEALERERKYRRNAQTRSQQTIERRRQAKREREEKRRGEAAKTSPQRAQALEAFERGSAVPIDNVPPAEDVLFTDRGLRSLFNSFSGILGANDWETGVNELLGKGGDGIVNWATGEGTTFTSPFRKITNFVLMGMVDHYGLHQLQSSQLSNWIGKAIATQHKSTHLATKAFSTFASMGNEVAQGVIDYLQNRNVDALTNLLPEERQPLARLIVNIAEGMDQAALEAIALGVADPRIVDENNQVILGEVLRLAERKTPSLGRKQTAAHIGLGKQDFQRTNVVHRVGIINVIRKDGQDADEANRPLSVGQAYHLAYDRTGDVYLVEQGIKTESMQRLGLLFAEGESPFRLRSLFKENQEAEFARVRTAEEISQSEEALKFYPSLFTTFHEMQRRVGFNKLITQMLSENAGIPEDSQYITDALPEDVLESRVISLERQTDPRSEKGFANNTPRIVAAARVPGTWVQIATDDSAAKVWGDMAGKWVAGPIYASLYDQTHDRTVIDSDTYNNFLRFWKLNKTTRSPSTHIQNIVGNVILMYMHDIPRKNVQLATRLLIGDWLETNRDKFNFASRWAPRFKLTPEEQAMVDEFQQSDATLGQFKTAELGGAVQWAEEFIKERNVDDEADPSTQVKGMFSFQKFFMKMAKADVFAQEAYSNQDNIFRLAAYMTHIQRRSVGLASAAEVSEDVRNEAATYAKNAFVNYNISAPWVAAARSTALPFIAFPYRMAGIMSRLAITKPWKVATVLGTIQMINALGYALSGADEDDERALLADYMQEGIFGTPVPTYVRLPLGDPENPVFYPVGAWVPVANISRRDPTGLLQPMAPSGPIPTTLNAISNYDPFLQSEIRRQGDTPWQQAGSLTEFLFKATAPQIAVNSWRAYDEVIRSGGKQGVLGKENNAWVDIGRVLGFNTTQVNMDERRYQQAAQISRLRAEYGRARNLTIKSEYRRGRPDEDFIQQYIADNADRLYDELQVIQGLE